MIIKPYRALQDDVLGWFDEKTTSSAMRENVGQALNAAQAARLAQRGWPFMKWTERESFTTIPGQRNYALHIEFFRPIFFYNATLQRYLTQVSETTDAQAKATDFELAGTFPVAEQPATATALTLTSTSTGDGASQTALVRGEIANGAMHEETLTCGAGPSTESFTKVIRLTKLGTWSGSMILSAGATELVRLAPSEQARIYQVLRYLKVPTAADLVEYEFFRQPAPMVNDYDVPDIPPPFQDILTYDALIQLAAYNPVEAKSVEIWSSRQAQLEQGLIETYGEPLALGRTPVLTRYVDRP